jgi:dTDP-4-dehydrorhamnose reductase
MTSSATPAKLYESVLITGGAGMLAAALKDALAARGANVHSLRRSEFDITDTLSVVNVFNKLKPTLLLNCAAYTKVDLAEKEKEQAFEINGYALGILAQAAADHGTAMVHYSTDYVFDGSVSRPLLPDDPVGPKSAYGTSKLAGEEMMKKFAPARWLILRTAWLYGRGGPCFPATMVNAARAGKPLKVVVDQVGSPTYTVDLAAATLDLLDRGGQGVYHVANAGQTNWRDFTVAILDEFGTPKDVGSLTSADWKAMRPESAVRPLYSVFDLAPLEQKLGRSMPTWRDALARYRSAVDAAGSF